MVAIQDYITVLSPENVERAITMLSSARKIGIAGHHYEESVQSLEKARQAVNVGKCNG